MAAALLLVMAALLQATAAADRLLTLAEVIQLRAAMVAELRTAEEDRMVAEDRTVAAGTVDMGGRIALDFSPAQ